VFESLVQGLVDIMRPEVFGLMMIGIIIGLIFGIIPGIGSMTAIAILMPMIWGVQPVLALTFLLALSASTSQGGSITAVLVNVPGTGPNAATMLDGFPMAQKGQAGRALGAVLAAGAFGGIFGGVIIIALIPVVRPMVLAFGSPELFFLVLLGLSFIAILTSGSQLKGLVAGLLGIMLALFGYQATTAVPRFTFGSLYLEDGIKMIPLILGLFAVPEVIDMAIKARRGEKVESPITAIGSGLFEGVKDIFRNIWLFIRCGVIGTIFGIIPGVGAEVATFFCYAHAKQTSKHPEQFGHGTVEGVIAPETASNAKEGGALLTTLAFGLPGSAVMALLLGAFLVVGITPGPKILEEHLNLSFSLVWTSIIANVISSVILLLLAKQLIKISLVRAQILMPVILVFAAVGAYAPEQSMLDVVATFIFALFGYAAKHLGYNRAAIILGFVLGKLAETYFLISLNSYGVSFALRPVCIILILIMIATIGAEFIRRRREKRKLLVGLSR